MLVLASNFSKKEMLAVKELIGQIIEQRHVGKINTQRQITKHTKNNTDKRAHKYKHHKVKIS